MKRSAASFLAALILAVYPALAETSEECLTKVKGMESVLPRLIDGAKANIHVLIPDPAAYEKTLPPFEKVVADSDKINFKNYGGLSEAYLFGGDTEKERNSTLFSVLIQKKVLGPDDTFPALVEGDLGLFYFKENNYLKAEPLILDTIAQLEAHLTASVSNNLIAEYMCITLIRDKAGKTAEASEYAKKLFDLAVKQREKTL